MSEQKPNLTEKIEQTSSSNDDGIDVDSLDVNDQGRLITKLKADRYQKDTASRLWLAEWAATVVSLWLIIVIVILFVNHAHNLGLSENVLIALLGTTTINVLGLMYIVLKGYFEKEQLLTK